MQQETAYGATQGSTRLMTDRPTPQEFFAQRREQNAHHTKQLKQAPHPTTFMTQRSGTPLPPPPREDKPIALRMQPKSKTSTDTAKSSAAEEGTL